MKKYTLIEKENKPEFEKELSIRVSMGLKPLWETFQVVADVKYHSMNFYILLED